MWRRFRGTVCAACLVVASVASGIAGVQMQAKAEVSGVEGAAGGEATQRLGVLARMHRAAHRQVQLGDLAEARGARPETRKYGAELAATFRAFDGRLVGAAARQGIPEQRLTQTFAGENADALRRDAEDLTRLGSASGPNFDRIFWGSLAQDQAAASDLLASSAGVTDAELVSLVVEMSDLLDRSSRRALAAAQPASGTAPGEGGAKRPATTTPPSAPRGAPSGPPPAR